MDRGMGTFPGNTGTIEIGPRFGYSSEASATDDRMMTCASLPSGPMMADLIAIHHGGPEGIPSSQ